MNKKLTKIQTREIRARYADGVSLDFLAALYNVAPEQIEKIIELGSKLSQYKKYRRPQFTKESEYYQLDAKGNKVPLNLKEQMWLRNFQWNEFSCDNRAELSAKAKKEADATLYARKTDALNYIVSPTEERLNPIHFVVARNIDPVEFLCQKEKEVNEKELETNAYQKAWREANKDKTNAYQKAWRESNKDKIKAYRKAKKKR